MLRGASIGWFIAPSLAIGPGMFVPMPASICLLQALFDGYGINWDLFALSAVSLSFCFLICWSLSVGKMDRR